MVTQPALKRQPLFNVYDVRIRPLPVVGVFLLAFFALFANAAAATFAARYVSVQRAAEMPWILRYAGHTGQLIVTLTLILIVSKGRVRNYGLRWPTVPTYVQAALVSGMVLGVVMTVVDYFPQLAARTPPHGVPVTATNIVGWLSFDGLCIGTVEEILFRGLLLTTLAAGIAGRVRCGRYDMQLAGVVLALVFCLAHLSTFWARPPLLAAGQQLYTFAMGILFAYWYEKSGSLLAPIIGHNLGNLLEDVLVFGLAWIVR